MCGIIQRLLGKRMPQRREFGNVSSQKNKTRTKIQKKQTKKQRNKQKQKIQKKKITNKNIFKTRARPASQILKHKPGGTHKIAAITTVKTSPCTLRALVLPLGSGSFFKKKISTGPVTMSALHQEGGSIRVVDRIVMK